MSAAGAVVVFEKLNLALELISAGSLVLSKLSAVQDQRTAEGREITREDVNKLMAEGDVKAALERAQLATAKAAQDAS